MKRSEYDRPRHPIGNATVISDTWICHKCGTQHHLVGSRWKMDGVGPERRRLCVPCWKLKNGEK